jgi:hypothetical protein
MKRPAKLLKYHERNPLPRIEWLESMVALMQEKPAFDRRWYKRRMRRYDNALKPTDRTA